MFTFLAIAGDFSGTQSIKTMYLHRMSYFFYTSKLLVASQLESELNDLIGLQTELLDYVSFQYLGQVYPV